ncbi:recQ-mediated genome instability protein 1-like isoform X2 [Epargyreus clarus]|uniref:recQ-mediated genome instability protein 1-like isoform X2 n=1 Tax=Epargyreus clarus TaxID=520877 RepID=UPI003C2C0DD8
MCVEYCIDDVSTDVKKIQDFAQEQWLLHDLKEICPGSLPPNLAAAKKTVLSGHHVLQINGALDISVPAYQQYLKMKKTDLENIKATMNPEEKISSKRMLKLDMTDGKQTIFGMEYDTLSKLNADIKPGSKILIKGPVQCREGMLLLTDKTVEMLGGEVPEMAETQSLAAQIASKLGLPMIECPDMDIMATTADNPSTIDNTSTTQNSSRQNEISRQTPQVNSSNQRQITTYPVTNRTNETRNHIDLDVYALPRDNVGKRQSDAESTAPEKRIKVDNSAVNPNDFPDDDELADLFQDEDLREIENQFEEEFNESIEEPSGPVELPSEPFVYIKQINELSDSAKCDKVFRVKAQILTVLKKLTLTDRWNLRCTLTDGTGCIDVDISSDILSDCLGFTPQGIRELKKQISTNPDLKNQINLAYVKTSNTLKTLYCIMELTMSTTSPVITRLIDFEDSHIDLLKKRIDRSGL